MTRQDITYPEKLNALRLDMSHPNSKGQAFVLVEGDSDIRLFRKLFDTNHCKVECIPGGNPKVEACVETLRTFSALVIGIRDADFIHLNATPYSKSNMFLTDFHDIEMTLIAEDAVFSPILFELTNKQKQEHAAIRTAIFSIIEDVSLLKWLNDREDLRINFGKIGFQDLISLANANIDFPQYFSRLLGKSENIRINDIAIVQEKINALKTQQPNPFQLSNGHDFMHALSKFLGETQQPKRMGDDNIASAFRISFTEALFKKTALYQHTKLWADSNNCVLYTPS